MNKKNLTIGVLLSIVICGTIIFSIEKNYSFLQIIIGFLVYILPSIFTNSLQSKLTIFLLSSTTIMLGFFSYKYKFYDVWLGVFLALLIGRTINFYKIKNK
jgi:hypothetical protein